MAFAARKNTTWNKTMKAVLIFELFGESTAAKVEVHRRLMNDLIPGLEDGALPRMGSSGWVAEITGTDPTHTLDRKFLRPKKDYSRATSSGNRGIYASFILSSGRTYEVNTSRERYFCTVDEDGEIIRVSKDDVYKSFGALHSLPSPSVQPQKDGHERLQLDPLIFGGMVIVDRTPTPRQIRIITGIMDAELYAAKKAIALMRARDSEWLNEGLRQNRCPGNSYPCAPTALWGDMERAVTRYNYCVNILTTLNTAERYQRIRFSDFSEGGRLHE